MGTRLNMAILLAIGCVVIGCTSNSATTSSVDPQSEIPANDVPADSENAATDINSFTQSDEVDDRVPRRSGDLVGEPDFIPAVDDVDVPDSAPGQEVPDDVIEALSADSVPHTNEIATLAVGDVAPPLQIGEWLLGESLEAFEPGKVHVVEFWATWCGPCLVSMPHLSELQTEYADEVRIVGISNEDASTVNGFLEGIQNEETGETWKEVISYRIALDAEGSPMNRAYMLAADQQGIPAAFVVGKDGRVEWIGHPMQIDAPLEQIVSGQWDLEQARRSFEAQRVVAELQTSLHSLIADASRTDDWSNVLAKIDQAMAQGADSDEIRHLKLNVLLLAEMSEQAQTLVADWVQLVWDDPAMLNQLAWTLATRIRREEQDHALALSVATRAAELSNHLSASILDTLARVYYEQGDLDAAITWQQRALAADDDGNRQAIQETLDRYQQEQAGQDESDSAANE